jgi:crossover junction endodeoxyribonuclease RuvC
MSTDRRGSVNVDGGRTLRVLGVDPGSQVTGFGVVERCGARLTCVASGTFRPPRTGTLAARLAFLHIELLELLERHEPDVASVEQVFVSASPRSALVLGQARGAVLAALGRAGVAVHEYAPAQVKQSVTGSGRATKDQIQRMVKRLLVLERTPATDAADALAAAICHAHAGALAGKIPARPRRSRPRASAVRVRRAT